MLGPTCGKPISISLRRGQNYCFFHRAPKRLQARCPGQVHATQNVPNQHARQRSGQHDAFTDTDQNKLQRKLLDGWRKIKCNSESHPRSNRLTSHGGSRPPPHPPNSMLKSHQKLSSETEINCNKNCSRPRPSNLNIERRGSGGRAVTMRLPPRWPGGKRHPELHFIFRHRYHKRGLDSVAEKIHEARRSMAPIIP